MRGNGGANLRNGKLVGVNVVAQALQKIDNLPAIGALVPAGVAAHHPELFRSNDTDIQNASLTFLLQGPRVTTHDLEDALDDLLAARPVTVPQTKPFGCSLDVL